MDFFLFLVELCDPSEWIKILFEGALLFLLFHKEICKKYSQFPSLHSSTGGRTDEENLRHRRQFYHLLGQAACKRENVCLAGKS